MLDLPGIIQGAKDGKGRGRQVIAVARTCNLIFIVLDVLKPLADLSILEGELEGFGIRLNREPPKITVKRKETGGVSFFLYTGCRVRKMVSRLGITLAARGCVQNNVSTSDPMPSLEQREHRKKGGKATRAGLQRGLEERHTKQTRLR